MKAFFIILGIFIVSMIFLGAVDLSTGYFGVLRTKTVEKAQQNANREVFEQTQSYIEGKREDLAKYNHEWRKSDAEGRKAVEALIRQQFANFDEEKIIDPDLHEFLHWIMHN